jgi:hypothetical protein
MRQFVLGGMAFLLMQKEGKEGRSRSRFSILSHPRFRSHSTETELSISVCGKNYRSPDVTGAVYGGNGSSRVGLDTSSLRLDSTPAAGGPADE